jgi:uncharacterized protein GlcG (DUF336 family)
MKRFPRRGVLSHPAFRATMAVVSIWFMAPGGCGGGSGGQSGTVPVAATDPAAGNPSLSASEVNTIVLQAIHEATARGKPATIAVVDRVGNVLTLTQMAGAPTGITVVSGHNNNTGLENQAVVPPGAVPSTEAALAKAITGAYLSSNGNAFSTRTANYIVQEHFPPGNGNQELNQPAGPLFGVQFSQLACSDFNTVSAAAGATNGGPHRSPLGFSADSGGLPIYKNGVLVGGIGVMTKSTYSDNLSPLVGIPIDDDEVIALAGETGFTPPPSITADNIAVGGLTLQYVDATPANFAASVAATGTFTPLPVTGYFGGAAPGSTANAGLTYGSTDGASGIAPDGALGPVIYPGTTVTSFVFTNGAGAVRFAPANGLAPTDGNAITAAEAQALETSALNVAYSARAAIRIPTNSFAQVTVSVVDLDGNILAMARTPDAPIFGADVSLQKARSALFFSRTDAATKINAITIPASNTSGTFAQYVTDSNTLTGTPAFVGNLAWSEVGIGDISRPFYPDGQQNSTVAPLTYGSLSLPIQRWSIFSTGIQLDLVAPDILAGVGGAAPPAAGCGTGQALGTGLPAVSGGKTQLANGLQIFSGGFPIYRGNELVGGIGISGDGIQQDSMISFLGLLNYVEPAGGNATPIANAPTGIRASILNPEGGGNLRYANCPPSPFLNSTSQAPCPDFGP